MIIAFAGPMGSGKDYIADHVLPKVIKKLTVAEGGSPITDDTIPVTIRHLALADQLKLELIARGKVTYEQCFGGSKDPATRRLLQEYGTGLRDTLDESIWIRALEARIRLEYARKLPEEKMVISITDCRFPNEIQWLRSLGNLGAVGTIIYVDAPGRSATRASAEGGRNHISERSLEGIHFKYVINNNIGQEHTVEAQLTAILDRKGSNFESLLTSVYYLESEASSTSASTNASASVDVGWFQRLRHSIATAIGY